MLDARDRVVNKTDMTTAFVVLTGVPVRAKLIHEISGTSGKNSSPCLVAVAPSHIHPHSQ